MDDRSEQEGILAHFALSDTGCSVSLLRRTQSVPLSWWVSLPLQMTSRCGGAWLRWLRQAAAARARTPGRPRRRGAAPRRCRPCPPSSASRRWPRWPPWRTCTGERWPGAWGRRSASPAVAGRGWRPQRADPARRFWCGCDASHDDRGSGDLFTTCSYLAVRENIRE